MRKQKIDPDSESRQRAGMRRWGRRNARIYDLWSALLSAAGYRRMVRDIAFLLPETGTAVDVGCGSGELLRVVRHRRPALGVVGCDLSPEFLAVARHRHPGARTVCADAERIPLRDGRVDAAVSLGVLGHLLSTDRAVAELGRIVRDGGRVAVWTRVDGLASRVVATLFAWTNPGVAFRLHAPSSIRAALTRSGIRIEREEAVAGGRLWIGTRGAR
jgi:ubiquinone/menaquinone biosynthesis C-methylase UbiE